MIIVNCEQYSPEWWELRLGKPTASTFSKIVTSTGKKSTSWKDMAYKFAAELERGKADETFRSEAMKRGSEMEDEAREFYAFSYDEKVEQVGLVFANEKRLWSCSPDGLMPKRGLEIKCPTPGVHKKYSYEGKLPTTYKPQVYGSLWICDEVDEWDFFSYHPDMEPFLITVDRDDKGYKTYVEAIEKHLPEFVADVKRIAA